MTLKSTTANTSDLTGSKSGKVHTSMLPITLASQTSWWQLTICTQALSLDQPYNKTSSSARLERQPSAFTSRELAQVPKSQGLQSLRQLKSMFALTRRARWNSLCVSFLKEPLLTENTLLSSRRAHSQLWAQYNHSLWSMMLGINPQWSASP